MSELRPRDRVSKQAPLARHGRLPRSRAWAAILKLLAATVAVLVVASGSLVAIAVADVQTTVKRGVELIGEKPAPPPALGAFSGGLNLLLAGSDSGGGDVATFGKRGETLNDVTMLLHLSEDHKRATVVSFPRDLFVPIPGCPKDGGGTFPAQSAGKMNTALTYGGLPCIVKTVEDLTGLDIPYAGLIEFQGVIAMSNAVGGVEVCVATAIHDEKISFNLDAGTQTLSGHDALQFLRTRYGVGDGSDLGRISNQQVFLSALVRKIKSADTLSNPLEVYALAKAAASNILLSTSLTNVNTIASIAIALKNVDLDNVVFVQYPNGLGTVGGQSGVLPIKSAANVLFAALKADQPIEVTGSTGSGSKLDPNAPPPAATTPSPGASADPPADDTPKVQLPSVVQGQTAAQQTCSKGQRAG
jgi:LCP family protein required for cell wall assembly